MIEQLLPSVVASSEVYGDLPEEAALFPAESAFIAAAVDKRRREFATVRVCARRALAQLGIAAVALVPGERGAPSWPAGVVGSMTHCAGYRAAAVATDGSVRSVGIDAEPHLPLPGGVLDAVSSADERAQLLRLQADAPQIHWDRMLFSAKEAVYKTWFPLTGRWLGFEDARLRFDPLAGTFLAQLLVDGTTSEGDQLSELTGRWLVRRGLLITAITLVRPGSSTDGYEFA